MNSILFSIFLTMLTGVAVGQRAQRVMLGAQADLIKSDNDGLLEKMQGGFEGSFYVSRKLAATAGLEWWSGHHEPVVLAGARFCPIDEAFLRIRGLLRKDVSFGGGFAKPLSKNLRIEAMADFYLDG